MPRNIAIVIAGALVALAVLYVGATLHQDQVDQRNAEMGRWALLQNR